MKAPQVNRAQIKHILYETPDHHAFLKQINQVFKDVYDSENGNCPHRPVDTSDIKVTGDMAYRGKTLICVYCSEEIEEIRTYVLKSKFPSAPRQA